MKRAPCLNPTESKSNSSTKLDLVLLIACSTEKTSGMFGTLVIYLPSDHTGGAVCLRRGEKEIAFSTAEMSAFNMTYVAWYVSAEF